MIFELAVFNVFLLVLARISGLVIAAPVLGSGNIPPPVKIGLSALTAMLLTAVLPLQADAIPSEPILFALMAVSEMAIGLMMGFMLTIIFAAIQVAGQIMDMLSGFALMNVFNPALETQVPVFGFFFFIVAILYLLVIDGHHLMLLGIARTFERIPLGGLEADPVLLRDFASLGSGMFYDGIIIAAPITGALLLTYLTIGFMGRVVPQVQLFVVGFPITIAISLFLLAVVMRAYLALLEGLYSDMFRTFSDLALGLG